MPVAQQQHPSLAPSGGEVPVPSRWPVFDLKRFLTFSYMVMSNFTSLITHLTPQGPLVPGFFLLLV